MRDILLALPDGSSGDWLRGLGDYLGYERELRGSIRLVEGGPVQGTLSGGIVEAVSVGLGSGGAITILVSGVVSWLRQLAPREAQPVPTELTMTLPNSASLTIKTAVACAWTQAELGEQIDRLVTQLSDDYRAGDHPAGLDPADAG
jgi:hypothetical protein